MLPTVITAAWLRNHAACDAEVSIVEREWPGGAGCFAATARKAVRLGLDVGWLAQFLPATARAAYDEAVAPAEAAYQEATATAFLNEWRRLLNARKGETR